MKLYEYQGADLFKQYKIPVAPYFVISSLSELKKKTIKTNVVVKAQVLTGKRGKHGGVKMASPENVSAVCKDMFKTSIRGLSVSKILIAEKEPVQAEWYLAITINRFLKQYTLLFSQAGGIDIEELAEAQPRKIHRYAFMEFTELTPFFTKLKLPTKHISKLKQISKQLFTLMQEKDASLVEINPLLLTTDNQLIAADSKVIIDNNALYRQDFTQEETTQTTLEKKAAQKGLQYVELQGNIGVIGNGAGMVMATLDLLTLLKGKPASFLDLGGGTGEQAMKDALAITLQKKVKGVFINIFGGITHCDNIAKALIAYKKKHKITIPVVVRMIGTNEEEARALLEKEGIHAMTSLDKAAKKIVELVAR